MFHFLNSNFYLENSSNNILIILKTIFNLYNCTLTKKKHISIDHCKNFYKNHSIFIKKWQGKSGIYKITLHPFKMFYYYGSSLNLGERFKYHFFNTPKSTSKFGYLLKRIGWMNFSVTVIELCKKEDLKSRELFYLKKYKPILNSIYDFNYTFSKSNYIMSEFTKLKISLSLKGKKDTLETRLKKSNSKKGTLHRQYGASLPKEMLDAAALVNSRKMWVYDINKKPLNLNPISSMRKTSKLLNISFNSISKYINTNKPFKGYYFYDHDIL